MGKSRRLIGEEGSFNPDEDRYPDPVTLLRRIVSDGHFETGAIDRLEVRCLASGEATYRYWAPRAEESDGGVLPAPETG